MQTYTPLWLRRRAQLINPRHERHEQVGTIVTDPNELGYVFIRWPDGSHDQQMVSGVRVLPDEPIFIEPTDDPDSETSDGGEA